MIYRFKKELVNFLRSPKLWTGLLIGIVGFLVQISNFYKAVHVSGYGVNIYETYVLGTANSWTNTISVAGLVFALSDMPYLSPFELSAVYRTEKLKRLFEKFLFNSICAAIYFAFQFIITVAITMPIGYAKNVWSACSSSINGSIKAAFSPMSASFISLMLIFTYGLMIISALFFLSLFIRKGVAISIIFVFQAIQHFMMTRELNFCWFCFFRNSILNYFDGLDFRIIANLSIELLVVFMTLIGVILIRNKISYDVNTEDL